MRRVLILFSLAASLVGVVRAEAVRPSGSAVSSGPSVRARSLTVRLSERGAVLGATTAGGVTVVGDPGRSESPFRLKLVRADGPSVKKTVYPWDAKTVRRTNLPDGLRFVFESFSSEAVRSVACTVRGGDDVRWTIDVETGEGWVLQETRYPLLRAVKAIGGDGTDDRCLVASFKGELVRNPGEKPSGWELARWQPGPLCCAFATYYDPAGGLYFATEDPTACAFKRIALCNDGEGLRVYADRLDCETGAVTSRYAVVTGGLDPQNGEPVTWHDAADRYRAWAERQRWCARRYLDRPDVPAWLKEAPAMVRFSPWTVGQTKVRAWMERFWRTNYPGVPLIAALWRWERHAEWVAPHYFPPRPDAARFADLVRTLNEADAHAFPWPSGYHWALTYDRRADGSFAYDDRETFRRVAEPHAVRTEDGSLYRRAVSWLKGGENACLCGGDAWTRDFWDREVCLPLARFGCDMVQLDQVCGGWHPPCWSRDHGHAPGEGRWKAERMREQLRSTVRTMSGAVKDPVVGVEDPNEFFVDLVAVQDYRNCESREEEWASVFNYVYHEYVPVFQSNPRRGNRVWQAHQVADGQIPFIHPLELDIEGRADAFTDFFRRWVALYRGEGRPFLAYGRQLKPPRVACADQPYRMTFFGDAKIYDQRKPTVFCGAYAARDGRKALVLVNATDRTQSAELRRGERRRQVTLQPDEIRLCDDSLLLGEDRR